MDRALVVYESMFGNTRTIAQAVADGVSSAMDTELVEVGDAPTRIPNDVSLLVVGGPTHAFGLSRGRTREDAARQAGHRVISATKGLREWLSEVHGRPGLAAVTFDTRIERPRVPGSAARAAERKLRRGGFTIAVPARSFYVTGTTGPLSDGEADRARRWGEGIARRVDLHRTERMYEPAGEA